MLPRHTRAYEPWSFEAPSRYGPGELEVDAFNVIAPCHVRAIDRKDIMQKTSRLAFAKQLSTRQQLDVSCEICTKVIPRDCKIGFHIFAKSKTLLFSRGDSPQNIFIVCNGTIKLSSNSKTGNTFIIKLASPGEVLGISAAIANDPYEITAETLTPCLLKVLPSAEVRRLVAENKTANHCVTELLARQHQAAVSETCRVSLSNTITERVARVLLKLKQGWHETDAYGTFPLLLTHQEIAEMVSSRRETVTRSITQLREEGIIALNGSNITILRHEQLEEMSA